MTKSSPFRYFRTSLEIIRLEVMLYFRFPLSLRHVEDLLHERGVEISHETVRNWWNRFGPMFAAEIRGKRVEECCQRNFACLMRGCCSSLRGCSNAPHSATLEPAPISSA